MEKLKNVGKALEKFLLRPALRFTKNRFKEKSSLAGLLIALTGASGFVLPPEYAGFIVDIILSVLDEGYQVSTTDALTGIISLGLGAILTPEKKKKDA